MSIVGIRKWIATENGRRHLGPVDAEASDLRPAVPQGRRWPASPTRSARSIGSGVPILEALDISAETAGNVTIGDVLLQAKEGVREGRPLADPLREHENIIPALMVQMIEVGEQTGVLDGMLKKVAVFYDQEVEVTVNNLTALLEPLLTVVMGAGVGMMVIALYLPMFDYIKLIHN